MDVVIKWLPQPQKQKVVLLRKKTKIISSVKPRKPKKPK